MDYKIFTSNKNRLKQYTMQGSTSTDAVSIKIDQKQLANTKNTLIYCDPIKTVLSSMSFGLAFPSTSNSLNISGVLRPSLSLDSKTVLDICKSLFDCLAGFVSSLRPVLSFLNNLLYFLAFSNCFMVKYLNDGFNLLFLVLVEGVTIFLCSCSSTHPFMLA
jgi:hypothetical protein